MGDSGIPAADSGSSEILRFVHCADLHLGAQYSMLPRDAADRRRVDQRQTFARIVDLALGGPPRADMLLIAGDVFDCDRPSPRDVTFVRSQLQRLADGGVRTFIVPGDRDPYRDAGFWCKADLPCTKLFGRPAFECYEIEDLKISVCGIAPDVSQLSRNHLASFDAVPTTEISVLLFHGAGLDSGEDLPVCHPFGAEELARLPFNYAALGHCHGYHEVAGIPSKAVYPGTPDAIGFGKDDLGDRFVVVGTIDKQGNVQAAPRRVNAVSHISEEVDCTAESTQSLRRRLKEILSPTDYAQILLAGRPSAEVVAASEGLAGELAELCAYADVKTHFAGIGEMPADNAYFKRFVKIMNARIHDAPSDEKPLLRKALELGTRAFMTDE